MAAPKLPDSTIRQYGSQNEAGIESNFYYAIQKTNNLPLERCFHRWIKAIIRTLFSRNLITFSVACYLTKLMGVAHD